MVRGIREDDIREAVSDCLTVFPLAVFPVLPHANMGCHISYNPLHPTLLAGRHKARQLSYRYNNLDPNIGNHEEVGAKQAELLGAVLGRVGSGTFIEPPFLPDYGCNVIIGQNCFMNFG